MRQSWQTHAGRLPGPRSGRSHGGITTLGTTAYRDDIDGLRAVSILSVVLFHAGVSWIPGGYIGVDVFFVISGYLITGILLTEAQRTQKIDLREFYARRARRLLPLSALALSTTLIAGWLLLPAIDRGSLVADVRAAALYMANWRFAQQAADYFGSGIDSSWLLHYWSLAIEEQFYFVWPLLVLGTTRLARSTDPRRIARALMLSLGALGGLSFLGSALWTSSLGVTAYFGTHLRIWELAVGAGLALSREHLPRIPRRAAELFATLGLGAIVFSSVVFDGSTPMPGVAALVPVLGAAAVLGTGAAHQTTVARLLAKRPFPFIGRLSYAWYLWHWPALAIGARLWARNEWTSPLGLVLTGAVAISLLVSWLSHKFVENPVRFAPSLKHAPRKTLALGALLTLIPVAAGAAVITRDAGSVLGKQGMAMTPEQARNDNPRDTLGPCMQPPSGTIVDSSCIFGDTASATTNALIGDSHAMHWFPAFERAARDNQWRLVFWAKSGCTIADARVWIVGRNAEYPECATWRENLRTHLGTIQGLELIVVGRAKGYLKSALTPDGDRVTEATLPQVWEEANRTSLTALAKLARNVVVLRDTPYPPEDVPSCLSDHLEDPTACDFAAEGTVDQDRVLFEAEQRAGVDGVIFLDLSGEVCSTDPCPVVTPEGIIIYRDDDHMTGTFAATLAPSVARALRNLLA